MCERIPSLDTLVQDTCSRFKEEFGQDANICAVAPGRVNLIGEHTDYNDGFVLPMALPLVTVIAGRKKTDPDSSCCILTTNQDCDQPRKAVFALTGLVAADEIKKGPKWANYVKGSVANFHSSLDNFGFNAVISTSVPLGGGLSSSASLEVATYTFLEILTSSLAPSKAQKALNCQKAEHEFALMPCGIMDQFVSVMGEEGKAVKIDCRSMEVDMVPMKLDNIQVLIVNSNVKHELTGSEYPSRRKSCEEAAKVLGKSSLRDVTLEDLEKAKSTLASEETYRRARHVITEIDRTVRAADALKSGDFQAFGQLMVESHISLRDDFEVSCPEIDQLVDIVRKQEGVFGSRITGGGFGGCTVTLLKSEAVDNVVKAVTSEYTGKATVFVCNPSAGARPVDLN